MILSKHNSKGEAHDIQEVISLNEELLRLGTTIRRKGGKTLTLSMVSNLASRRQISVVTANIAPSVNHRSIVSGCRKFVKLGIAIGFLPTYKKSSVYMYVSR